MNSIVSDVLDVFVAAMSGRKQAETGEKAVQGSEPQQRSSFIMIIAILPPFALVWCKGNVLWMIGVLLYACRPEQWEKLVLARVSETRHIFPLEHLAATCLVGYAPTSDCDTPSCMPR